MSEGTAAQGTGRRARLSDQVGVKLAGFLAIALFPLLLISVVQSMAVLREARARSEAALMGETMRALAAETRLIQRARAEAQLAALMIAPVIGDDAACIAEMRKVTAANPNLSLAAYIPLSGKMTCSSRGEAFDFSASPLFAQIRDAEGPAFIVNPRAPISGVSILGLSHPVLDDAGHRIGVVSLSLPHQRLQLAREAQSPDQQAARDGLMILTFDKDGEVLTSSGEMSEAREFLPADRALKALAGGDAASFTALSNARGERAYGVVELVPGQLYALGSWPASAAISLGPVADIPPLLFPLLMWAGSLFVAYFAVQNLVIRHVQRLARAFGAFASGNRIVGRVEMDDAPKELRDLSDAFEKMTETILHDEAELEDTIHHKEVLLREVHHRVKNNLQLIASIINMQMRQARTPEARELMGGLQERVMSLATIHRGLYQTTGLGDIAAQELLPDIVRQIVRLATGPGRRIAVDSEVAPMRLTPDQAVPLSLLLTELLTNAMKYASAAEGEPQLRVRMAPDAEGRALLEVWNTVDPARAVPEGTVQGTGLGARLTQAFVQQLGGTSKIETAEDHFRITVRFVLRPLNEAEQRHAERQAAMQAEAQADAEKAAPGEAVAWTG